MFFGGMPFSFGGGGFEEARGPARPRGKVRRSAVGGLDACPGREAVVVCKCELIITL